MGEKTHEIAEYMEASRSGILKYGPWAKSSLLHVVVNKDLLKYSLFTYICQWLLSCDSVRVVQL